MTAQELLAEQIELIGDSLAHYIETTAPDRLNWQHSYPAPRPPDPLWSKLLSV